jgi:arylsulfatase A-like enzyme
MDVDDPTVQRVRELYAAEVTYVDKWMGRLLNELADQNLLDETVVYYISDHGLTLGEHGILGKHAARAQWHIYHVPCMIRHPEGKLAGETSGYFASTHDVAPTLLSFMGVRAPGLMDGEDLTVLFEGREPTARPWFTSCYDDHVLAGDADWFLLADSEGMRKRLYDKRRDVRELHDVAAQHPELVERLWRVLSDEAGGTLPQFSASGAKAVIGG